MLTSRRVVTQRSVVFVALIASALLYLVWPWLQGMSLGNSSSAFSSKSGTGNLLQFFASIKADKRVLFLGTSESTMSSNLAAQLNYLAPNNPQMLLVARGGLSPIHSSVAFALFKSESINLPPIVLVLNPVYFTESHDIINDGWLSKIIPSPVFLQMNHRNIHAHLSEQVQKAYAEHFALKRVLYLASMQEYLGNLLYLYVRQSANGSMHPVHLAVPRYKFNGLLPDYDEEKAVWASAQTTDKLAKSRWRVKQADSSLNLEGLASIIAILRDQSAPVLLLILPVNRTFYESYGLDMAEFDQRYDAIRDKIRVLASERNIGLIDLFDTQQLHLGFRDRMHPDQYGNFQLAKYLIRSGDYNRFIEAVRNFYAKLIP